MKPKQIMVDLETWGTTPGSDLRSIGAVEFDFVTGAFGDEFYVNVDGGGGYGLTKDESTKQWWADQSAEAQARLEEDVLHIADGLTALAAWWKERCPGDGVNYTRFWAHGPHFDEQILAAAFRAVGIPVPWHYRAPRDLRTCLEDAAWTRRTTSPITVSRTIRSTIPRRRLWR